MTLWQLAADEHGILDAAATRAAGLTASDLRSLTRTGDLTALRRGFYAVGSPTCEELHRLRTRAELRRFGEIAVASHHSALLLQGLPHFGADLGVVRLSRTGAGPTRTWRGIRIGRAVPADGCLGPSVVAALAVVQVGMSGSALAALIAADAALHAGLATKDDLTTALGWVSRHPGSAPLRSMLTLADGRRESPGETRLAYLLHLMNLPSVPQFQVRDGDFTAYADFALTDWPVLIEFDGRVKYQGSSNALFAEKVREDRLRSLGYEVVRVTWADLDNPRALAARIRAAVERARRRAWSA